MISKSAKCSFFEMLIKNLNDLLLPIVYVPAVLFSILPLFQPMEGSNSREKHIAYALCAWAVILVVKVFHNLFKRRSNSYQSYKSKIARNMDLNNLIPLLVLTVIVVFPFYLLFVTSIKNNFEAMSIDFTWWPKDNIDIGSAYGYLMELKDLVGYDIARSFVNAVIYAVVPALGGLLVSAVSAYAFSKLQFRAKKFMYAILIATMMMPGCVTMATSYMLFDAYGWTNSALPIIVPGLFGGASMVMFLREFFMGIPDGLLEAAEIDGAGRWRRFVSILLPLAKPALTAQFVLSFIAGFNNFMGPLFYLNDAEKYPIQLLISTIDGDPAIAAMQNVIAAAGVCAIVPMLIIYIVFQKTILSGISISSGLKG